MPKELSKTYEPSSVEPEIYAKWLEADIFKPTPTDGRSKAFCIIAPPPNANGALHIGHAVGITLQDLMARYHRMRGEAVLWLPGYDHAGFETQVVYEKKLDKEGRNRFSIPRDQLYQEMYDFTQANIETVRLQLQKLGASLDWSKEIFTLDPRVVKIVYQTFKKLYDDGLVYRALRPVNWCSKHQTSLSDLETKYEERAEPFYYFKYGPFTIGTSRPETKFGDKYVVMHPADKRYEKYYDGQKIEVDWLEGPITATVIKDEAVDREFGTGVMTITPAHDVVDFEIATRHHLSFESVIDKAGKLLPIAGQFASLHIAKARPLVVAKLKEKGLLERVDEHYTHSVAVCYKCGTIIEPQVLPQWFIATTKTAKSGKNLRADAIAAVKTGDIKFVTKQFETVFNRWMENLRDWNISRQIVWGIQMPVWYCEAGCEPIITDGSEPEVCPNCGGKKLTRDSDVFDTWFSSGQWPFAALRAQDGQSFERFYPTSIMETAYDILFFWVARMIMLGVYVTDKVPFKHVYIHGLVRDKDRQKMSKSKGNVIDPLGVAAQYGSDAVRLALIFGTSAGNDIVISEEKIRGMRNFVNKLWNVARFIMMNLGANSYPFDKLRAGKLQATNSLEPKTESDKQILNTLNQLTSDITDYINGFQFHIAAERLYDFVWHELADQYIEAAKGQLQDESTSENTRKILLFSLLNILRLLHPFMPFVTEAIYQSLPITDKPKFLAVAPWPGGDRK